MSNTVPRTDVIIGVDTPKLTHAAVAISTLGARLGAMAVLVNSKGYRALQVWAQSLGPVRAFGAEGTGSYGAGLSRFCASAATRQPWATCAGARPRGKANPRSSAASNASSPARSTAISAIRTMQHPRHKWPLDLHRSINAMAESFCPTLKAELLSRRRVAAQAEARMACLSDVEGCCNPVRLHSGLGCRSPMTYEDNMQAVMTKT